MISNETKRELEKPSLILKNSIEKQIQILEQKTSSKSNDTVKSNNISRKLELMSRGWSQNEEKDPLNIYNESNLLEFSINDHIKYENLIQIGYPEKTQNDQIKIFEEEKESNLG